MSGGIFKKQKMPSGHRENRWSEGRESWGLEAPDTPELRPVLLHLVGEGALGPTEGLGNGAVGDVAVVHPHGDDGVRIGVKLPKTGEEAVKQAVSGCTGKMVGFKRVYVDGKYTCEYELLPLNSVANFEKKVPMEWINAEHNGLTKEFIDYALPLIQGEPKLPKEDSLPRFARLKKVLAK